jgi:hypothetical protein
MRRRFAAVSIMPAKMMAPRRSAPVRAARWPPTAPASKVTIAAIVPAVRAMRWLPHPIFNLAGAHTAFAAALLVALFTAGSAQALDLFAAHYVDVQFATHDGKPMADAEVTVFAPGEPNRPYTTGRTDADGKFRFDADRDGFWTAEARNGSEVARATVRVGSADPEKQVPAAYIVAGALALVVALAVWQRWLRARRRGR